MNCIYQNSNPESKGRIRYPAAYKNTERNPNSEHQNTKRYLDTGKYRHRPCIFAIYTHDDFERTLQDQEL
jgi:hypothetical protein